MYTLSYDQSSTPIAEGAPLKLGRAQSNDIVCSDPDASRFHGELKIEEGQLIYRDLESTNGTVVDGEKVTPYRWQILAAGSTITIGGWSAKVAGTEAKSASAKSASPIPVPTVDPSGPKAASELTQARPLPPGLVQE